MTVEIEKITQLSLMAEEPDFFLQKRLASFKAMDDLFFPRFQKAKYRSFKLLENPLEESDTAEVLGNVPDFLQVKNGPVLYQEDEVTLFSQLSQDLVEKGVIFTDLKSALVDYPELVKEYYMTKAVLPNENKLTAFHAAFVENGVFLYVPKNVVIKEPIEMILAQKNSHKAYVKHILVVAGENSEFSFLQRVLSTENSEKLVSGNIVAEVIGKPGAKVKYAALDELGKNVTAYLNYRGYLMKDATVDWSIGMMSSGNVLGDFDCDLVGEGAHAEIKAVAVSSENQEQIIDTRVTNKAPHTTGHILQHGVILDASRLTFNGIGHIFKGAHGSDAQQESRVLILSDEARGDANPILLIDDNDVTAGHAASVGQVDPEDLYYLMSRGISEDMAQRLVIRGFLGSVITSIPLKDVQQEFINVIEGKLNAEI